MNVGAFAFWFAVGLLLYSYVLYPLFMVAIVRGGRERTHERPPEESELPTVAVIVAAFNEEKHIRERVGNLLEQQYPSDRLQILVGSDGSADRTAELARSSGDARVRVLEFKVNRGKASVINDLVAQTDADILVFTDANTVFEPQTILHLVRRLADPGISAVCGELILEQTSGGSNDDHRYWSFERRLKAAESSVGGLLGANGAVYAIRRRAYRPLASDTICDDFIVAMNIAAAGEGLVYEPLALAYEDAPDDVTAEYGRRVRIGIGNYQALFRHPEYLFGAPCALRVTYFSHKVLRWLTPHLLLAALTASAALSAEPLYAWLFALQLAGYVAALGIFLLRDGVRWPAPMRGAMLFAVLNVAFGVGFARFLTGAYRGGWRRTQRA